MDRYRRQNRYFVPAKHNKRITVIGCGSLGGNIAVALAKMGLDEFDLFDMDTVEEHNVPNQPFNMHQIGEKKTEAVASMICSQFNTRGWPSTTHEVNCYGEWDETVPIRQGIIINAPDSIAVRKSVFERAPKRSFIVDVRSGPESYNVYFCDTEDPKSVKFYSDTFFDVSNAVNDGCGAQSTVFGSLDITALAVNGVVRHVNNERVPCMVIGDLMSLEREQTYLYDEL